MNKIVKALFGLSVSALLASCGCSPTAMSVSSSPSSEQGGGSSSSSSDSTGTSSDTTPSTSSDSSASSDTSQSSTQPAVKYTLTLDSKGGSAVTAQTIDAGGKFTKPTDPTKEGYDFAGWYKEDTYQNAFDFNAEVTANVTIYAKWTEKATPTVQYTITFDSKGGSAVATQTIEAGEKFSIPDDPTKEGYDFAGWYKEEACENEFDFNAEVTASVTVYAKWTAQVTHYVLTFVTGEGASSIAAQTIDEGQKFTKPANPTKQGYDFAGWYQDAEYQSEFDFDADVTADVTIYAKWTEHITVYSYALARSGNNWEAEAMTKIDDPEKLPDGFDYAYAVGNGAVKLAENEAFRIEVYEDGTKVAPYGSQATIIQGSSYVTADEDHNLVIKAAGNYVIALFHSAEDGFGIVILESQDIYAYTIGEKTGNMTYHIEDEDLRYEARNIEAKAGDAVSFTLNGEPFAYQTESEFLDNDGKVIADGTYTFIILQNGTLLVNKEVLYTAKAGDQDLEFNAYKNEENTQIVVERTELEAGLTISFTADGQPIEFEIDQASAAFFENGATASKGMYSFTLTISDEGNSLMVQFVPITGVYGYKVGEGEEQPLTMNEFSSYEVYEAEGVKFKKGDQLTFLKDGVAYPIEFNEKDIFSPYYYKEGVIQFDGTYEISLAIGEEKGSLTIFRTDKAADNIIATINDEIVDLNNSKIEDIGEHDIAGYSIDLAKGETIKFYMAGLSYDIYETLGDEVVAYYQDAFEAPYTAKYNFYLDDEGAWNVKLANTPTTTITATVNEQAAELVNAQVTEGNRAVFTIDLEVGDMLTLFDGGEEMMFYVYDQEADRVYPDSTLYSVSKDGTYTIYVNDNVQRRVWIVLAKEKVTYSYKLGEEGEPVILDKNNSKEGVDLSGNKQIAFSVEAKQGDVFILNAGDEAYVYSVEGEEGVLDENFAFVEDGKYDVYFKYEIGKIYIAEHPVERVLGILVDGEAQEIAPEEDPGNNKAVYKIDLEKDAVLAFEMDGDPILMHIVGGEEEPLDELTVVNPGQYIIYWNTKDEIWVQIPASESAEYSYYLKNSGDWSTPIALEEIEEPLDGYDAIYEFEGNLGAVEFGIEVQADDAFETWLAIGRQFLNPLTGDISDTNELVEVAQNNLKLKAKGYYAIGVAVKVVDGERNYYLIVMEGEDPFEPYDIEKLGITVNEVEVADLESYPDPKYRQQAHGTIASAKAEDILTFFYEGKEIPDYLIEANSDPNNNLIVEDGLFKLRAGGTNLDVYFQVIDNDEFTVWVSGYEAPTPVEKVDLWVRGTAVGGWETTDNNQFVVSDNANNFGELNNVHLGLGEFKLGNEDFSIEYNWYNYKSGGTNFAKVDGEGSDIRVLVPGVYNIYAEAGTVGEGKHGLYIILVEADEKISITYESNGGSVVASEEVYPTQSFEEPDEPERLGYEFKGWFLDNGTFEEEFDFSEPQDENVIVYAKWDVITYTISYELGEGGVNAQGNPDSYNIESEEIELADPTKESHRFVGWYSDEDRTVPVEGVITTGSTGNKVFYAKFVDASLKTVTFVTGEGASLVPEGTAENGTPFTRPENNPTKPGYTFVDWYEKEGEVYAAQPYDFSTNASADLTLYAKWEIINYTITYHLGVGETNSQNNPASYTIITETFDLLPATKEDYVFGGWFSDEGRSQQVYSVAKGSTENIDLYPLWLHASEYYIRGTAVSGWDIDPANVLYEPSVGTDYGVALGIALYQGEFKIANETWTESKTYGWIHHDAVSRVIGGAASNFSAGDGGNIRCNIDGRYNVYLTNNGYISFEFVEALPARPATYGINHAGSGNWPMSENLSPVELSPAEQETLDAKCHIDIALAQNEEFGVKISNGALGWYNYNNIGDEASKEFVRKAEGQNDNIVAKAADTYHIVVTRAKNGDVKIYISLVKNVVTLDIDGNTDTKIVLSVGESLAQPDDPAPKTGYTFVGWFEVSEGGEAIVFPLAVNADKTIYARYTANQYRVVFHGNGGAGEMDDLQFTYDGEQHALTANAFTRDYYNFVKWNTQADGQGTDYANQSEYALLPGLTVDLYAQWTPIAYTINYVLDGGVLAEANPTQYTVETATFALHNPTKENYNFTGWYDEGDHHIESITIGSHGNLTLTARWSQKYVLTFHNADVASIEENNEHKFVRPDDPTKTGYEFVNWYKEEGLVNPFDFSLTVSANGDAYAKWTAINYSVRFNANGGTGEMANEAYAYDESKALTANAFTKAGYDFAGWALTADGDVVHTDAKVVSNLTSTKNAVVDLYAKWTVHNYSITYNLDEGTNAQANPATYNIEGQDIVLADATKDGYTFLGWYDAEEAGNKITTIAHDHKADVTLYAHWEQIMVYKIVGSLVGTWDYNNVAAQTITVVDGVGRIEIVAPAGDNTEFGIKDNNAVWYGLNTHEGGNVATTAGVKYVIEFYPNRKGGEGDDKNNFIVINEWAPVIAQMTGKIGESDMDFAECGDPQYAGQVKAIVDAHVNDILTFKYNGESIDVTVEDVAGNKATLDGNDIKITEDGEMNVYFKAYKNGTYGVYVAPNYGVGIYVRGTAAQGWGDAGCVTSTALKEPDDAVNNLGQLLGVSLAVGDFKLAYLNWNEGTWSWTKQGVEPRVIGGAGSDSNYFEKGESDDNIHCKVAGLYNIYLTKNGYISIEKTVYTMTFNPNGGSEVAQINVHAGTGAKFVEPSAPEKAGYTFGGWYTDQGCAAAYDWQETPSDSLTVYAKWTVVNYDITYTGGGVANPANPAKYNVETETFVLTNPTKAGYIFTGWSGTGLQGSDNKSVTITVGSTGDRAYEAHWDANNYTINYSLDGGSVATPNPTSYTIETPTFTLVNPTKNGYAFEGWRLDNQGDLMPTVTISQGSTGNKSYTAYWTNAYSVTYNGNGNTSGEAPAGEAGIANNVKHTVAGNTSNLAKTGYTFNGWNTQTNGLGTHYDVGNQVAFNATTTLYAEWAPISYILRFAAGNGGSGTMTDQTVNYGEATAIKNNAFTKDDYHFANWQGSNDQTYSNGEEVTNLSSVQDAVITLTAVWAPNEYSITYNLDDGTNAQSNPATYTVEDDDIVLADATKDGYTFLGWFDAAEAGNKITTIAVNDKVNKVLYAHWQEIVVYKIVGKFCDWSYEDSTIVLELEQSGYGKAELLVGIDDTSFKVAGKGVETNRWFNFDSDSSQDNAWVPSKNIKYVIEFDLKKQLGNESNKFINITEWAPQLSEIAGTLDGNALEFISVTPDDGLAAEFRANAVAAENGVLAFTYKGQSIEVAPQGDGNSAQISGDDLVITQAGSMSIYLKVNKNGTFGAWVGPNLGIGVFVRGDAAEGWGSSDCIASTALQAPIDSENNRGQIRIALKAGTFKLGDKDWGSDNFGWANFNNGCGASANFEQSEQNINCKVAGIYDIYLTKANQISIEKVMYTMTFDVDGGSEIDPIQVHAGTGAKFVAPSAPEKAGYTFGGWYTDQGCTEAYDWQSTPNASLTVYAKWTATQYTISYTGGGVADPANPTGYTIETATFALTNPTRAGYTFTGWSGTDLQGNANMSVSVTVGSTGNRSYEAHWNVIAYTIAYDLDGGSVVSANPEGYNVETATFTLNNPTKDGYAFAGWKLNDKGDLLPTVTITQGSTGNLSYKAYWNNAYSVTYNGNGNTGGEAPASQVDIENGTECTVAGVGNLVKTGYSFNGWNTLANGTGQAYAAGAQVAFNQNTVLFAQWQVNNYTVNFVVEEGETVDPTSKSVTYGSTYGVLPTATKDGYEFAGWFTSRDGGTEVTSETSVAIVADQNLYPHWNKISTVTLNVNDGTINAGNVTSYVESKGATLPTNVTKDYYTFAGWFDNVGLNGDPVTTITAQATGNQAFWAKWTPNVVTVTYNANGGQGSMDNSAHNYGAQDYTVLSTNTFTKANYAFVEWNTQADGNGTSYAQLSDADFETSKALDLYAIWQIVSVYTTKVGEADYAAAADYKWQGSEDKAILVVTLAQNDTLKVKAYETNLHFYHYDGQDIDDGDTFTASEAGTYVFYVDANDHIWSGMAETQFSIVKDTGNGKGVYVAGSWDEWNAKTRLEWHNGNVWSGTVANLGPGLYQFKYIIANYEPFGDADWTTLNAQNRLIFIAG